MALERFLERQKYAIHSHSLVPTGPCPAHVIYILRRSGENGLGLHQAPKIITENEVKDNIRKVASGNSTKSTKDIMKGFGIGYIPTEASSPAGNTDPVKRERKMALGK